MEKSITLLLIKAGLLILSLDSQAKWEDWNTTDKNLYKSYVLATALDYMQSKENLGANYYEANPFLPNHPSSERLLLQKIAASGIIYWAFDTMPDAETKRRGLYIVNGIQWGVVIRNEYIGATFRYRW